MEGPWLIGWTNYHPGTLCATHAPSVHATQRVGARGLTTGARAIHARSRVDHVLDPLAAGIMAELSVLEMRALIGIEVVRLCALGASRDVR